MTQPGWPAGSSKTPQTSHMRKPQICLHDEADWAFLQSASQYQSHFFFFFSAHGGEERNGVYAAPVSQKGQYTSAVMGVDK